MQRALRRASRGAGRRGRVARRRSHRGHTGRQPAHRVRHNARTRRAGSDRRPPPAARRATCCSRFGRRRSRARPCSPTKPQIALGLEAERWHEARAALDDPGISRRRRGAAGDRLGASALHDPTEGGLLMRSSRDGRGRRDVGSASTERRALVRAGVCRMRGTRLRSVVDACLGDAARGVRLRKAASPGRHVAFAGGGSRGCRDRLRWRPVDGMYRRRRQPMPPRAA